MKIIYWLYCAFLFGRNASAKCNLSFTSFNYVVEHAVWRGWQQALIYTLPTSNCQWEIQRLVKCLGLNGIATALNINDRARLNIFLGIIILNPIFNQNETIRSTTLEQLTIREMNTASYDWLIVTKSIYDFKAINDVLNKTAIRFDQNIVVIFPQIHRKTSDNKGLCKENFLYNPKKVVNINSKHNSNGSEYNTFDCNKKDNAIFNCYKTIKEVNYYKTSARLANLTRNRAYKSDIRGKKLVALYQSGIKFNFLKSYRPVNISQFSLHKEINMRNNNYNNVINNKYYTYNVHVVQYFKVRINSTLFATYLGTWSLEKSMASVQPPVPLEARNFMGEELIVGRCNYSAEGAVPSDSDGSSELLDDVLQFLSLQLNATPLTRNYEKLGFRTYEGVWSGLLGALMDHSVDIALEPVTAVTSHHRNMDFMFPISKTMFNIYIRHQETSAVRDIFLAPFSLSLIACVFSVVIAAAVILIVISRITAAFTESRNMGFSEALIWSTGVLCQQGGSWTPLNLSSSILLIVCLLFALVIYNSYAAFITSVLSVRVASVGSVADVLQSSNLKIGYVKNSADQMYLMTTKDAQLNEFYIRGYSEAENLVSSAEEGLVRAAKQDYAFFAGQRVARSTLRSLSQTRGRCALRELPVYSTSAQLAFPLSKRSPYARHILVSLLQMRSSGVLAPLESALVPRMPQCVPPSDFASARATDVRTALGIIVVGLLASIVLGIVEYCWKHRKEYTRIFQERFNSL